MNLIGWVNVLGTWAVIVGVSIQQDRDRRRPFDEIIDERWPSQDTSYTRTFNSVRASGHGELGPARPPQWPSRCDRTP